MERIKVGIAPLVYEGNNYRYTAQILKSDGTDLGGAVGDVKISLPTSSSNITSMRASFSIDEKLIRDNETVSIKVCDEVGNPIYSLTGEAKTTGITRHYNGIKSIDVIVVDELDNLFEKQVAKDVFFFDQWLYNHLQKENSILYRIAKELGFRDEDMAFEDIRDTNSELIKIPLMIVREGNKWIDELHTLVDCARGMLYMENGKLVFKSSIFEYAGGEIQEFNSQNILKSIKEEVTHQTNNGVRLTYDSFKYLENQVVFDLAEKIEVQPNTAPADQNLEFNIQYITDIVTQHNLTAAEGYYYTDETVESLQRVQLQEGVHYDLIEFKESKAKVKFYNPYEYRLYIDKFEIKGVPVAKYEGNEAVAKDTYVTEKNQENFTEVQKNKYIQTEKLATNLAKLSYKDILTRRRFSFTTSFMPGYELGKVYGLVIDDIFTKVTIDTMDIELSRSKGFSITITASEFIEEEIDCNISITENQVAKDRYLDDLKNKIEEVEEEQKEVIKAIGARGFVSETDPAVDKDIKEPDVWFNPVTKEFKVWRNNQWNPAREEDIPPALMTALKAQAGYFTIGGNDVKAGIFFSYDNDPDNPVFGTTDTEHLAEVSIGKDASILIRNANNKMAFNMRNPENPSEIVSQFLMGVYNSDDEKHKDTLFQVGDEATGNYMKFVRGKNVSHVINGKPVEEHLEDSKKYADEIAKELGEDLQTQIDGKIDTWSQEEDPSTAWDTDLLKQQHHGDLWYKPSEKMTKRYKRTGDNVGDWENQDTQDTVTQELAKSKRRVFTTTPVTPYDEGDLWITATTNGDLYICRTTRETGDYVAADWKKATKYTDDTKAGEALENQNNGKFIISSNTSVNGTLEVFSETNGIISYNGTTEANSTKRIIIRGGEILFQEWVN